MDVEVGGRVPEREREERVVWKAQVTSGGARLGPAHSDHNHALFRKVKYPRGLP